MDAQYNLSWSTTDLTRDEVLLALAPLYFGVGDDDVTDGMVEEVEEIINGISRASWDAHERHLATISAWWPDVVFTMLVSPEDGPQYVTFCKNGRMYSEECTMPAFDQDTFNFVAEPPSD